MQRRRPRKYHFNPILFLIDNDNTAGTLEQNSDEKNKTGAWKGPGMEWWAATNVIAWNKSLRAWLSVFQTQPLLLVSTSLPFFPQSCLYFIPVSGSPLIEAFSYSSLRPQSHPWIILFISHLNYLASRMLLQSVTCFRLPSRQLWFRFSVFFTELVFPTSISSYWNCYNSSFQTTSMAITLQWRPANHILLTLKEWQMW